MDHAQFIEAIRSIPGEEGFWISSAEDQYISNGQILVGKGISYEESHSILSSLYWAAASCYGS
jgi:hypothetical protein